MSEGDNEIRKMNDIKFSLWKNKACKVILGVMLTQIYCLTITISMVAVQFLQRAVPDFELNAIRSGFPTIVLTLYFIAKRTFPSIPKEGRLMAGCTVAFNVLAIMIMYVSVSFLALGTFQSINITVSLGVGLFAFLVCLKEAIKVSNVIAALVSSAGVILVLQPYNSQTGASETTITNDNVTQLPFSTENGTDSHQHFQDTDDFDNPNNIIFGYCAAIIVAILFTVDIVVIKKLAKQVEIDRYQICIVYWLFTVQFVVSLILSLSIETTYIAMSSDQLLWVFVHALLSCIIYPSVLAASVRLSGNTCNMLISMAIVYMVAAQYTVLSDVMPGHRNWQEGVGLALVFVASLLASVKEFINSKNEDKK